jgi:hypothetical protein
MKRVFPTLVLILLAATIASAQTTFYYPHVVNGVQGSVIWKTTILLTNPSSTTATSGVISLSADNSSPEAAGSPMSLNMTDQNGGSATSSTFTFSLPPDGTTRLISDGAGQFLSGFATVSANVGTVSGTAIFSEFDSGGNLLAEAGVPSASAVAKQSIFVDTINSYKIGVAYANPGNTTANIKVDLLNSQAQSVLSTAASQVLGPGNHVAAFTFQMFPNAPQSMAGTMQIVSNVPLAAIALRFDPSLSKFTTLPPVSLASLINPALEWLQQRAWLTPLSSVARLLGAFQLKIG